MFDKPLSERVNYIIGMRTVIATAKHLKAHRQRLDRKKKMPAKNCCVQVVRLGVTFSFCFLEIFSYYFACICFKFERKNKRRKKEKDRQIDSRGRGEGTCSHK